MSHQSIRMIIAVACLSLLQGCGGGGGVTGPTAAPGHAGTYSGLMTYSDDLSTTNAQVTVSQTASTLSFTSLALTAPAGTSVPLGTATLTGDDFSGALSYDSSACGRVALTYEGRFSGSQMHLKVNPSFLSPPSRVACPVFSFEGDLVKQ